MPIYEYQCPQCGTRFTQRQSGYTVSSVACSCGATAERQTAYRTSFVMGSGALPPADNPVEVQQAYFQEVRKAGWDEDRAITAMRKHRVYDDEGRMSIDLKALPATSKEES